MAAVLDACSAKRAFIKLQDMVLPRKVMNTVGAQGGTAPTANAHLIVKEKLCMDRKAFGIVTPGAPQWTSFQEDSRAYAWSVL